MPAFNDVFCLSHLRWGFVFQRPNHLMSRAAKGRRVFFVEEPVFDTDTPRIDVNAIDENLLVVVPHLVPWTPPPVVDQQQRALLEELGERHQVRDALLWFYTPIAIVHAPRFSNRGVVYDCMDELSHFAGASPIVSERERDLFGIADLVFTGGQSLYEAKRTEHPRVHAFPSSVDSAHFAKAREGAKSDEEPEDQRAIPHPRVGFFGVVDERMDLDLLRAVAAARPQYQFVVIGPIVKIDHDRLPRSPNIHWLGQKGYAELPSYIAGWDAAIMPFARNDATKFISPTKTLEYLAAGKPVVSTSIRDVVRPYGAEGLVRIADEPRAFAAAIDAALDERDTDAGRRRCAAADAMLAQTSWDATWERMDALVDETFKR